MSEQSKISFFTLQYLKLLDSPKDFEKLRVVVALRPDKLDPEFVIELDEPQKKQVEDLKK
jgi:hypothetical protein